MVLVNLWDKNYQSIFSKQWVIFALELSIV